MIKIQKGGQAISIEYSHVKKRPLTLRHSSGSKITVTYSDNGLLREARLEDESGNAQQIRGCKLTPREIYINTELVLS